MAINSLKDFFVAYENLYQTKVPAVLISDEASTWTLAQIGFTDPVTTENLVKSVNREELNLLFEQNYAEDDSSKQKGTAMVKIAIGFLYSYSKGLVARHKTRLQYYRDDLSQKGARGIVAFAQSYRSYEAMKNIMEQG